MESEETKTEETASTETEQTQETQVSESVITEPTETEQLKKQVEDLQASSSELQGRFDTLSQDSTRQKQYLDEITPYVDFDGYQRARQPGEAGSLEGDDQSFLTKSEAKALEQKIETRIATAEFQREFRTKYADLGDKGPKEEMVRFFFENKTLRTDSFDKRIESAVKATRNLLKNEVDTALKDQEAEKEKAEKEKKAKDEAAAKASGLSSGTITSPKTSDEKPMTSEQHIKSRRDRQLNQTRL